LRHRDECEPVRDGDGFGYAAQRMLFDDAKSALASYYIAKRMDRIAHDS
jgi:hypothetical protein